MKFALKPALSTEHGRDLEERLLLFNECVREVRCRVGPQGVEEIEVEMSEARAPDGFEAAVKNIIDDVRLASRKVAYKTVYETDVAVQRFNPHPALLENHEIVPTAPGEFVFQGDFLQVMRTLDRVVGARFHHMGCKEQSYPSFLNANPLFALNYYETMSQHLFFAVSLKGSYDTISAFSQRHRRTAGQAQTLEFHEGEYVQPRVVASPSVCFHCFSALQNRQIARDGAAFTGQNKCHREERSGVRGLERLQSFTMREAIFAGDEEFVAQRFAECLEFVKRFFGEDLGLRFRLRSAGDVFFGQLGALSQIYQSAMDLKYEIQVYLPYADSYLACGSVNNHMSTMAKAFDFRFDDGSEGLPASMCIGIGYERLALVLMAQKGLLPAQLLPVLRALATTRS